MEGILKEYWWLSIMTIPVLAFALWLLHKRFKGRPLKISAEVKRLTFVKVILLMLLLNFGVWGVGTIALRGDAVNGKVENNSYFLNWKGQYAEVSRGIYFYSLIHTWITIASFPVAIVLLGMRDHFHQKSNLLTNKDRSCE